MSRFNDLTGQKFNEWTALEFVGDYKWKCQCSCGVIKNVDTYSLTRGLSKSCGHVSGNKQKYAKINIGDIFGELTVIAKAQGRKYTCQCSCGNIVDRDDSSLKRGESKDCGHSKKKSDLTGMTFGEWTVLREGSKPRYWVCECSCGKEKEIQDYSLTSGRSKSCGHPIRDGENIEIGKTVWNWTIIEKIRPGIYRCKCKCGNYRDVNISSLRYGYSKSCGCMQGELREKSLLEKYGERATNKVSNPREPWQIDVVSTKDNFEQYLVSFGYKPDTTELSEKLGINRPILLKTIHKFELEELVAIGDYRSHKEKEVYEYLKNIYSGDIVCGDKSVINPYELDIYIPDKKIAIEFNGNYWHSEIVKDKDYHLNKTKACRKAGIHLIHVFEYEWDDAETREKLKAFIRRQVIGCSRIYARDCGIRIVEKNEAMEFTNKYHLQGAINQGINFGLFYGDELVELMCIGKSRFSTKEFELLRMVTRDDTMVVGGASKLFQGIIRECNIDSIVSYCDLSKFSGKVYFKMGFKFCGWETVKPGYVWYNNNSLRVVSRYDAMKHKLVENNLGSNDDTEVEIMHNLGFWRIYNCGNLKFVWSKSGN